MSSPTLSDIFILIEGALLIGSFMFTIYQFTKDRKERKFAAIDVILKSRREVWSHDLREENLQRFKEKNIDLQKSPITMNERNLVENALNHFNLVFVASKAGLYKMDAGDRQDIAGFLSLPIPNKIWKDIKKYHKNDFVNFIDKLLKEHKQSSNE